MAYNEKLAEKIRELLKSKKAVTEKKMFGGLCFLYNGNMCVGVTGDKLMVRVGKENYVKHIRHKYAAEMDFTGRPMKSMVYVWPEGLKRKDQISKWLEVGIDFAKSLPRK